MRREQLLPPEKNIGIYKRVPEGLEDALRNFWIQHFGASRSFNDGTFSGVDYIQYHFKVAEVTLALEHLHRTGIIKSNPTIFESNGRVKADLPVSSVQDVIFQRKLLSGVDVLVIGGPEGRVFAEMGATVVGFDHFIDQAPKVSLPNLEELARSFGLWDIPTYKGRFHLTLSSRLLDWGSGLVSVHDEREGKACEVYSDTLKAALEVTRVGGIGIHNGDAIPDAIENNLSLCNLLESAIPSKSDKLGGSNQIYVLQRI